VSKTASFSEEKIAGLHCWRRPTQSHGAQDRAQKTTPLDSKEENSAGKKTQEGSDTRLELGHSQSWLVSMFIPS